MSTINEKQFKTHDHSGGDKGNKISVSNIEVNPNTLELVKESRLDFLLKSLEKIILNKIEKTSNILKPLIIKDGVLTAWGYDENDFANKEHKHDNYISKVKGNDTICILKSDGSVTNSNVKVDDLATKNYVDESKKIHVSGSDESILVLKNNIISSSNKTLHDFVDKEHTHEYLDIPEGDGIITKYKGKVNVIENDFATKNHSHKNYVRVKKLKDDTVISYSKDEFIDTNIKVSEIATKSDLSSKLDNINSNDDYKILVLHKYKPVPSSIDINSIESKGHKHTLSDIKDLDIDKLLSSSEVLNTIIDERIKQVLGKLIDKTW